MAARKAAPHRKVLPTGQTAAFIQEDDSLDFETHPNAHALPEASFHRSRLAHGRFHPRRGLLFDQENFVKVLACSLLAAIQQKYQRSVSAEK